MNINEFFVQVKKRQARRALEIAARYVRGDRVSILALHTFA